jgi:hypothetical protein
MITHVTCEIEVCSSPTIRGSATTTIEASANARPTDSRTERSRQKPRLVRSAPLIVSPW